MKKEVKIEDSPFYVEYHGQMKDRTFKMPPTMLKALEKHLENKYSNLKFGTSIRLILSEYLQQQCLERRVFNKSLFAIVDMVELKSVDNPKVTPLTITNLSNFYMEKEYKGGLSFYNVHRILVDDLKDDTSDDWSDEIKNIIFCDSKQYSNSTVVLDIALNNYLDSYHDGIYSKESDSTIHTGANFIGTTKGGYGLIYEWTVQEDYIIKLLSIKICNQKSLLDKLKECGNDQLYDGYYKLFKSHNEHFPDIEIDMLNEQIADAKEDKLAIDEKINKWQTRIDQLKTLNKY